MLLQQQFSIHKEYKFVDSRVVTQSGTYSVSAVGFDENKARAIVLVQYLVRPPGSVSDLRLLVVLPQGRGRTTHQCVAGPPGDAKRTMCYRPRRRIQTAAYEGQRGEFVSVFGPSSEAAG